MARELDRMSYKGPSRARAQGEEGESKRARIARALSFVTSWKRRRQLPGFKMSDLFGGRGGKGRKVAAKYVNPDDASETWTGRGRKPRWLSAKLKDGDKIEKFLIK